MKKSAASKKDDIKMHTAMGVHFFLKSLAAAFVPHQD